MLCTPSCSVCLKNYSKECKPVVLQPCSHGLCETCVNTLKNRNENPLCPVCRTSIVQSKPNYDLREITNDVDRQDTYWGKRLMEIVDLPGQEIEINIQMEPFCKIVCYRLSLDSLFDQITDNISNEQQKELKKFKEIWRRTMMKSDVSIEDAMTWLKVFRFPPIVHRDMIEYVLEFFEKKYFLEKYDALWIMDAIRV